jgi:hypothetical protein
MLCLIIIIIIIIIVVVIIFYIILLFISIFSISTSKIFLTLSSDAIIIALPSLIRKSESRSNQSRVHGGREA